MTLATTLHVAGTFEFTEDVTPDPRRTEKFESVRLLQISTMFIDNVRHDVNALRLRTDGDIMTLCYDPTLANLLLPVSPCSWIQQCRCSILSIQMMSDGPTGIHRATESGLAQLQAP